MSVLPAWRSIYNGTAPRAVQRRMDVMREAAHALVSRVPEGADRDLILWIVDTVSHAVIHGGVVERPDDVMSGRLGEELSCLLLAYLRVPRS